MTNGAMTPWEQDRRFEQQEWDRAVRGGSAYPPPWPDEPTEKGEPLWVKEHNARIRKEKEYWARVGAIPVPPQGEDELMHRQTVSKEDMARIERLSRDDVRDWMLKNGGKLVFESDKWVLIASPSFKAHDGWDYNVALPKPRGAPDEISYLSHAINVWSQWESKHLNELILPMMSPREYAKMVRDEAYELYIHAPNRDIAQLLNQFMFDLDKVIMNNEPSGSG